MEAVPKGYRLKWNSRSKTHQLVVDKGRGGRTPLSQDILDLRRKAYQKVRHMKAGELRAFVNDDI